MANVKEIIREALERAESPGLGAPLSGSLEWVAACDGFISLKLHAPALASEQSRAAAAASARAAVGPALARAGEPFRSLIVEFVNDGGAVVQTERLSGDPAPSAPAPVARREESQPRGASSSAPAGGHRPLGGLRAEEDGRTLSGIKHVIAVGAGKGGVGKSSIAVALAVGLARRGHAVGLLDGDIYGPSMPTMLGLDAMEQVVLAGRLQPHAVHGIKAITIGKLVDPDKALIWRGPMAHGAFKQLVEQTDWGELDYLIVDLPPGTGDVCLTMAQTLQLTGAVVVCTPQKVAQDDAVRAARMFQQLKIDVLGVVENMSYFIGDDGKEYDIFGRGGAEMMAQRMGLPFLGSVPITIALRASCDSGEPLKSFKPETAGGEALPRSLENLVTTLEGQVALASLRQGRHRPTLTIG